MNIGRKTSAILAFIFFLYGWQVGAFATESTWGRAILTGPGEGMVAWKSAPDDAAPSHMSYFQGVEVLCLSDPGQDWVEVSFGNQTGLVRRDNLQAGQPLVEGAPYLPVMVVAHKSPGAWLNLRAQPSMDSPVLGKYKDGQLVTVYGVSTDYEWAHVGTSDGKQGFMVPFYLWNHNPLTQHFVSERLYESFQRMERGLEAHVMVGEHFAQDFFFASVLLTLDHDYTTLDDLVGFNLYLDDQLVNHLTPGPDSQKPDAALISFAGGFPFHGAISKVHLVPVLKSSGENKAASLLIYQRQGMEENTP